MRLNFTTPLFLIALLVGVSCSSPQKAQPTSQPDSNDIKVMTQTQAAIVGGMDALYQQLTYPAQARENGVEATLEANVLINRDSKVEQITFNGNPRRDFATAARKALRSVTFRAGQRNGQPIDMYITIPIAFRL